MTTHIGTSEHFPSDWGQLYAVYAGRLRAVLSSVLLHDGDHADARTAWFEIEEEHEKMKLRLADEAGRLAYDRHRRA